MQSSSLVPTARSHSEGACSGCRQAAVQEAASYALAQGAGNLQCKRQRRMHLRRVEAAAAQVVWLVSFCIQMSHDL
jgi:hypothetical protein